MTVEELKAKLKEMVEDNRRERISEIADMMGGLINTLENYDINTDREKSILNKLNKLSKELEAE